MRAASGGHFRQADTLQCCWQWERGPSSTARLAVPVPPTCCVHPLEQWDHPLTLHRRPLTTLRADGSFMSAVCVGRQVGVWFPSVLPVSEGRITSPTMAEAGSEAAAKGLSEPPPHHLDPLHFLMYPLQ